MQTDFDLSVCFTSSELRRVVRGKNSRSHAELGDQVNKIVDTIFARPVDISCQAEGRCIDGHALIRSQYSRGRATRRPSRADKYVAIKISSEWRPSRPSVSGVA